MIPSCWRQTKSRSGGLCSKGYFDGMPSFSDCKNCPDKLWPNASSRAAGYVNVTIDSRTQQAAPVHGPGTELKKILKFFGINATPQCNCNAYAAAMDRDGPDRCLARIDEIIGWLAEEAKARNLIFSAKVARGAVLLAIKRARAKELLDGMESV